MNILVTNDDGIASLGLRALVDALSGVADVYVCAPDGQRSAVGHGITMRDRIPVREIKYENAKKSFATGGLPADCVKLGLWLLKKEGIEIDTVFAGINHGGNLGVDVYYSGTVAAAREGLLRGKKAVAVSVNSHQATHFGLACKLAVNAAVKCGDLVPEGVLININTPNLPEKDIRGIKYARLGPRGYNEGYNEETDQYGTTLYTYYGEPLVYDDLPDSIDTIAMQEDYATITPIQLDCTDYTTIRGIPRWGLDEGVETDSGF